VEDGAAVGWGGGGWWASLRWCDARDFFAALSRRAEEMCRLRDGAGFVVVVVVVGFCVAAVAGGGGECGGNGTVVVVVGGGCIHNGCCGRTVRVGEGGFFLFAWQKDSLPTRP
jgi:hypothetical protein